MKRAEIVAYGPQHRDAILELQERLWSQSTELNRQYFQWKFVDNPHAASGALFLALSDGRLVGMRGFMGTLWRDPTGGVISIPLAGDTVVARDYEGLGIVNRLSEAARDEFVRRGVAIVLNTSASPAVHLHSFRAGWKTIGLYARMRRGPRPRDGRGFARALRSLWPARKGPIVDPFAAAMGESWRHDGSLLSLQATVDPRDAAALCARMPPSPVYAMVRDADFFRWRFSNPLRRYCFLTSTTGNRLEGYIAVSWRMTESGPDVRIVDWTCLRRPQFRGLLAALARFAPDVGVTILVNACRDDERQDLLAAGFREIVPRRTADRFEHRPGVLGIPTTPGSPSFQALVEGGFSMLEFKGIESDGA